MDLPELITLESENGDAEAYIEKVYNIFLDEVVKSKLRFLGLPVRCQYRPESRGKHFGFWHLISEGKDEDDRDINFRRCERIKWVSYLIRNANSEGIYCWENKRKSNIHIVIWCPEERFIVVLAKRHDYFLLKTAYVHNERKTKAFDSERRRSKDPRKG